MSLSAEGIKYIYGRGTQARREALKGVSLIADRGEWISIAGHTGCGKTTLAQHLNLLLTPDEGRVVIDGEDAAGDAVRARELRRHVGLVFQYPEAQFFAETVRDEISFAPANWGISGEELERAVSEAASAAGLSEEIMSANPFALSGGQMRRVALASVLSAKPDYLVLDEPAAGLDAEGVRRLYSLIRSLRKEGLGIVQITHELDAALAYSDKVMLMEDGRSVFFGEPEAAAEFLLARPVRGLSLPPTARFCAGLRERGISVRLTAGIDEIVSALVERSR